MSDHKRTIVVVMGTFIFAAAACSGTPGGGGAGGKTGTGGVDGGLCNTLSLKYADAVTAAVACTPGAPGQCQVLVSPSPTACPGSQCADYQIVNDGTAVQSVLQEWLAACEPSPGSCTDIGCREGIPAACVPTSPGATTGTCAALGSDAGVGIAPDGGQSCTQLAADYVAAVAAAKSCTPGAPKQCASYVVQRLGDSASCLPVTLVNDPSGLNAVLGKWSPQCDLTGGLFECSPTFTATCLADADADAGAAGTGSCVDVQCGPGMSLHSIVDDAGVEGPAFCAPSADGGTDGGGHHPG
jgi:hypothetical protein